MVTKTVIALCLFQMGVLIEHTIQSSFSECLEHKRIMERNMKSSDRIMCGEVEAEIEVFQGKEFIKNITKSKNGKIN